MSALLAQELATRLGSQSVDRLVIAPLLEPDEQLRPGQASVDVRLGSRFRLPETTTQALVDTVRSPRKRVPKLPLYVPLGQSIVLHPHQFMLGETLEYVRLPRDLMAYVVGRSSWGRDGLIVATAVGVHPEFSGCITLELRNLGEVPIALYPGDLIAQLFVHTTEGECTTQGPHSQFAGAAGPVLGHHRYSKTAEKLRLLAERDRKRPAVSGTLPRDP